VIPSTRASGKFVAEGCGNQHARGPRCPASATRDSGCWDSPSKAPTFTRWFRARASATSWTPGSSNSAKTPWNGSVALVPKLPHDARARLEKLAGQCAKTLQLEAEAQTSDSSWKEIAKRCASSSGCISRLIAPRSMAFTFVKTSPSATVPQEGQRSKSIAGLFTINYPPSTSATAVRRT